MVSQPIMTTIQKVATQNMGLGLKSPSLHRTHFSAPSGNGYHQHHHVYHMSDTDTHGNGYSHSDHGGGKKRSIALSALTLLAFLFFLNILQNCLDDQMNDMNPQIIVMSSRHQQLKEAQKRLADSKAAVVSNIGKTNNNERKFVKLQRKADTVSSSNSFFNTTKKISSSKNNKNGRF